MVGRHLQIRIISFIFFSFANFSCFAFVGPEYADRLFWSEHGLKGDRIAQCQSMCARTRDGRKAIMQFFAISAEHSEGYATAIAWRSHIKNYLDDNSWCAVFVPSYRVGGFSCWFLGSCDNYGREIAALLLWCGHFCVEVRSSDFSHKTCTIAFCCFFSTAYRDGGFSRLFSSSKRYYIGAKAT